MTISKLHFGTWTLQPAAGCTVQWWWLLFGWFSRASCPGVRFSPSGVDMLCLPWEGTNQTSCGAPGQAPCMHAPCPTSAAVCGALSLPSCINGDGAMPTGVAGSGAGTRREQTKNEDAAGRPARAQPAGRAMDGRVRGSHCRPNRLCGLLFDLPRFWERLLPLTACLT